MALPLAAGGLLIFGKLSLGVGAGKFLVYRGGRSFRRHSVFPYLSKGGTQILKISKKGELEKKLGWGKPKGGKDFQK